MDNIQNLDYPFVMSEIMSGDIDITPVDIINQLIKNGDYDLLADMLNDFYQTQTFQRCKPIDDAIREVYDNGRD